GLAIGRVVDASEQELRDRGGGPGEALGDGHARPSCQVASTHAPERREFPGSGPAGMGPRAEVTYAGGVADARDWLGALARAWRAERMAVRARLALERSGRALSERVALGIALDHLRIIDEQSAPGDRVRIRVAVPDDIDLDNLRLSPGDPIRLWAEHPDE